MKTILILFFAVLAATGLLLAQGQVNVSSRWWGSSDSRPYNCRFPPSIALPEAYTLALAHIGAATNRFHCLTASCLESTNSGLAGWTFSFSNTNNQRARVVVFYDKKVWTDSQHSDVVPR
jgi:hypothetical protein